MEKISTETISYIAKLAKLKFTEKEALEFANEFKDILTHFENIDNEDLTDIDAKTTEEKKSVLRKDTVSYHDDKKELFKNAKELREGYISIPKVIE